MISTIDNEVCKEISKWSIVDTRRAELADLVASKQSFNADACDIGCLLSNHDDKKLDIRIINANNLLQITPMKRNPLVEMQDG
jgi:hypothetical protein